MASGTESLLEGQPFAHQVFTVSADMPWRAQWSLGMRLRRQYDAAFVLTASDRPMALARIAAPEIHALIPASGWQYAWKRRLARRWIPYETAEHMVWRAMRLAGGANLPLVPRAGLEWTDEDENAVRAALPWDADAPFAHVHPFARWRYKWWPRERWRELMQRMTDAGLRVVVTAAPGEREAAEALAEGLGDGVRVLAGRLNWRQLACLSRLARVFVGLDTANTHLAAGAGARVVALYGPTDPRIWGPWPVAFGGAAPWRASAPDGVQRRRRISLLQGKQACVPCQLEGCERRPDSDAECLSGMSVDRVWNEAQRHLEARA